MAAGAAGSKAGVERGKSRVTLVTTALGRPELLGAWVLHASYPSPQKESPVERTLRRQKLAAKVAQRK